MIRYVALFLVVGLSLAACNGRQSTVSSHQVDTSRRALAAAVVALRDRRYTHAERLATLSARTATTAKGRSAAYTIRALSFLRRRQMRSAFQDYSRAIEADETNWYAHMHRGILYALTRRQNDAMADANRAVALKPNATTYTARGIVLMAGRQHVQARQDFGRAIEMAPKRYAAYYWRAVSWHLTGATTAARADYNMVLKLDPFHRASRRNLDLLNRRARPTWRPQVQTPKKSLDL